MTTLYFIVKQKQDNKILIVSLYKDKLLGISYENKEDQEKGVCSKAYLINMTNEVVTKLMIEKIPERQRVVSCNSERNSGL